jgi:two-component system, OmpR family, copper resistance phosphate regulon response regulator CusR
LDWRGIRSSLVPDRGRWKLGGGGHFDAYPVVDSRRAQAIDSPALSGAAGDDAADGPSGPPFIVRSSAVAHNKNVRILLVEDETRVAGFIAKGLRENAYAIDIARDGEQALYHAAVNQYDLVILDLMLPVRNGYEVCRELRASGFAAPILMLTARDAVDDRVEGLDCGADDYMSKPFDFKELLARLRALMRRSTPPRPAILQAADLTLDTASHAVQRNRRPINLTAKEYALLEFLLLNRGRVVGREEISQHVWDEAFDPLTNTIDVYIKRLRNKLDSGGAPRLIHTRRGEGYILTEAAGAADE